MKRIFLTLLLLLITIVSFAANLFWVGGTGTYDGTTNHFATSSGGSATVAAPTSADNVTFDANSNATAYTFTCSAVFTCNNLTMGAPASGSLTWAGSSAMNITGNFSIASGSVRTYTGILSFVGITGTQTITTNSVAMYSITFNGIGGTFQFVGNLTIVGNLNLVNGTVDFTTNTTTVTFTSTSLNTSSGNFTGSNSFYNLTITGTVSTSAGAILAGNITCTNNFIANGNSITNRLFISSSVPGTPRTITAANVTITNADFQDITGAGAGSWDLHAITGLSGDCGGNSGITFTTPTTQHWTNASSGNWGLSTNWTSRIPLPQDNVVMDKAFGTSQTITVTMARLGASIDWTGATWTTGLTWAITTTPFLYGSLTLISGLTCSGTGTITAAGRGSYTINTNGVALTTNLTINAANGIGTYTLAGNLGLGAARTLTISSGTFVTNNYPITTGTLTAASSGTLTLGTETDIITGSGTALSIQTGSALNASSATIKFTNTTNSTVTLAMATSSVINFGNIWFSRGASTGINYINSSTGITSTFNSFKDDGSAAHTIQFLAGMILKCTSWNVSGTSGNLITLNSSTSGAFSLVNTSGLPFISDYLNIQHCIAKPGNYWFAGINSVNNQSTTSAGAGWAFTTPTIFRGAFMIFIGN